MRLFVLAIAVSCVGSTIAAPVLDAQAAPATASGSVISLADAITLARRNNPTYLNTVSSRRNSAAALKSATGAFLPNVSTSFYGDYREGKTQLFQGTAFGSTNDQVSTQGSVSASLNVAPGMFSDRAAARSNLNAADADISSAEQTLRANVTTQYMTVLQQQARAVLQDTLLVTTNAQLELARARLQVGSGTQLDVQRAEVANGQQRVAALNAHNQTEIEKLRLFQAIGIAPIPGARFELDQAITLPTLTLEQIIDLARKQNPALEAARERENASHAQVRSARSQYYPSLSVSTGVSGYTSRYIDTDALVRGDSMSTISSKASCIRSEEVRNAVGLPNNLAQCQNIAWSPAAADAIRDAQGKYPFNFSRNPLSFSAQLSVPIFNGFRREQQIEQAIVQRTTAENATRDAELRITSDVTSAMLTLTTSQQTVAIQEQNSATARLALSLAQERYRAGLISLVELVQARSDFDQAETDRITAVYDFHRAFAQLEAAAGRPLR